jgi:riboflavin synthase
MFTGIVEKTLPVLRVVDFAMGKRLTLAHTWPDLRPGESIACNGVCLTIAEKTANEVSFDVIAETLDKTNLGALRAGDKINVERAMKIGDRIDGHFVQGHVDGRARLIESRMGESEIRLVIECPDHLVKYLAPKGSVSIDGVSLTIAALHGHVFEVALIPTTLSLTTLGDRPPGWQFNLETDVLSKTIVTWLERRAAAGETIR